MEERQYAYWICTIPGIGCIKINKLLEYFGSLQNIYKATDKELLEVDGITERNVERIIWSRDEDKIISGYIGLATKKIVFTYKGESSYPTKFYNIVDAPFGIFYKGCLPESDKPAVAVIGARNASYEGKSIAERMGRELAENGIQVVSGLARGIDICGQRGAMSIAGGKTYGVLGSGIDICYPREHIEDYMLIQRNGGIISEFSPGMPPYPGNFPMRNRIISCLADGILVIEAGEKSGSLITAELGVEQGKDIFVVPGSITNPLYSGGNKLIQSGAALVTSVRDVMDAIGIFYDESITVMKKKNDVLLETTEKIVYASLSLEPAHVSEIAEQSRLTIQQTMEKLISLEIKGLISMVGSNYYAIKI